MALKIYCICKTPKLMVIIQIFRTNPVKVSLFHSPLVMCLPLLDLFGMTMRVNFPAARNSVVSLQGNFLTLPCYGIQETLVMNHLQGGAPVR